MREQFVKFLRHAGNRPYFPEHEGDGIIPWIADKGIHTRLLLSSIRDESITSTTIDVTIEQYNKNGNLVDSNFIAIEPLKINILDFPQSRGELDYGWSLLRKDPDNRKHFNFQVHFQVISETTFAKTHGRTRGFCKFPKKNIFDNFLQVFDPFPYSASTVGLPDISARHGILILNITNQANHILYGTNFSNRIVIPPMGAHLLEDELPTLPILQFKGSAPFTFYISIHSIFLELFS